jgi:hypothetical protein
MWEPRRLTTLLASTACYRDSFTDCLLNEKYKSNRRPGNVFRAWGLVTWWPPEDSWNEGLLIAVWSEVRLRPRHMRNSWGDFLYWVRIATMCHGVVVDESHLNVMSCDGRLWRYLLAMQLVWVWLGWIKEHAAQHTTEENTTYQLKRMRIEGTYILIT